MEKAAITSAAVGPVEEFANASVEPGGGAGVIIMIYLSIYLYIYIYI